MISSFDTNVLVYATDVAREPHHHRACDLLGRAFVNGTSLFLLQTFGELSNVSLRKYNMPADKVGALIEAWCDLLPVCNAESEDVSAALKVVAKHGFQFWDAVLWATAKRVGVQYLLTEDFQDGQIMNGVHFVNPFNPANYDIIDLILPSHAT